VTRALFTKDVFLEEGRSNSFNGRKEDELKTASRMRGKGGRGLGEV
jgi:hypothetical protein